GRVLAAWRAGGRSFAVPSLVMAEAEWRNRVREGHAADDLRADLRMDANLLEFFLSERTRLRQDVFGHRELPDVMQQRGGLHALDLVFRHAARARESGGVPLHAPAVALRRLILHLDGQRVPLDRRALLARPP